MTVTKLLAAASRSFTTAFPALVAACGLASGMAGAD